MRIFCSFAYTDENQDDVTSRMLALRELFDGHGVESYCDLFDDDITQFTEWSEFMRDALAKLRGYDWLFVINTSERRSEGMLIEVGAALERGMPIVYAQHASSVGKTNVPSLAARTFTWQTEEDLLSGTKIWLNEERA